MKTIGCSHQNNNKTTITKLSMKMNIWINMGGQNKKLFSINSLNKWNNKPSRNLCRIILCLKIFIRELRMMGRKFGINFISFISVAFLRIGPTWKGKFNLLPYSKICIIITNRHLNSSSWVVVSVTPYSPSSDNTHVSTTSASTSQQKP